MPKRCSSWPTIPAFRLCLKLPCCPWGYRPKQVLQEEAEAAGERLVERKLPPLSPSAFGWISQVMSYSEEEMFELVGMDSMVYLSLVMLSFKFFVINLPIAIAVMVVNVTDGDNIEEDADDVWTNRY